jgi:hypothetical protein
MVTEIKLPNCFKSSLRLKLTECAKAITFLLINDRVLMVYIGNWYRMYCTHFSLYFPMHGNFSFILFYR